MPEPLQQALERLRGHVLDPDELVRAVVSGRRRGQDPPPWRRVELRWVDLRHGRHLQVTTYDATQAHTANHLLGDAAQAALDELVALPFGSWHVETTAQTHQLRVTKRLLAQVHTTARQQPVSTAPRVRRHDRAKDRLLAEDDPVLVGLGLSDERGRLKPSRAAKYRQVEELLRLLEPAIGTAIDGGRLRTPTAADPLRVVDLGCGNGYLTLAAQRYLGGVRGWPISVTGVDVKEQSREHNTAVATGLGDVLGGKAHFVVGSIDTVELDPPPEVVLALHACDTATDDALARAVGWGSPVVLAAPCCHHDVAAQLRGPAPTPFAGLTRDGILRERFADTLTDALRAGLLRLLGYQVDVVEFVGSAHTPRNTLLRATRRGAPPSDVAARAEYDDLVATWGVRPALGALLDERERSTRDG